MFQIEFWHWWVLALIFVVFEGMIPSGVFAAMAISGGILGGILLKYPFLTTSVQLGIFGSITLIFTLIFARYKRKQYLASVESGEKPPETMLGKEFELTQPIRHGFGEVEIDGQHWSLKGPDTAAGTLVRVLRLDGDILMVMSVDIINQYQQEKEQEAKTK